MAHLIDISPDCLHFVIHHVFLPPQLPQNAEASTSEKNSALLQILLDTSKQYARQLTDSALTNSTWPAAVKMLDHFGRLENTNSVSADSFATAVEKMMAGDVIGIHISSQNAGLVLSRIGSSVLFTSFEASPTSSAVTETTGKLLVSYPGPAISVPWVKVTNPAFLTQLANFVEKMKRDVHSAAVERGSKAGETLHEERETTHPRFVSEMLTGILRAVGEEVDVKRFMKRIGDEVLWDNAKIPWRRSPLWLVIRVALRIVLGEEQYKWFMILFMARVLDLATRKGVVEEDLLFIMNAKVTRRVCKLRDRMPGFVLDEARVVVGRAYARIEEGWLKTQGRVRRLNWQPWTLNSIQDTIITMLESRKYVMGLKDIMYEKLEISGFVPNEEKRIDTAAIEMPDISQVKEAKERKDIMLADFETWVMDNLDSWLSAHRPEACNDLGERIEDYMGAAKHAYQGNPQRNSVMILTTMELWVALDKVAVKSCPLLLEYSPEFNESFLSALLLPQTQQRTRLARIEAYIKIRRSSALPTSVSIFSNDITNETFSVRYFSSSREHKLLLGEILKAADAARRAKIVEFEQKEKEYDRLQATIRTRTCDYFIHWPEGWSAHDRKCKKCAMVKQADHMRIEVHEWPLPDTLAQEAVIFELWCPAPFAIWRETTFRILTDFCSATHNPPPIDQQPYETAAIYSGLKSYFDAGLLTRKSKLSYTSTTKSFLASHYRYARLPTTVDEICVKNALRFALYDASTHNWTSNRLPEIDIRHLCTFRIPDGPYKRLQYTLRGTSHTANQVLTRQYECPPELQLHEYIAFGLLRSGPRLQWLNMLRELRSRTLTFSAEAVNMLYLQAAWQVGPTGGKKYAREYHVEPGEYEFGRQMTQELSAMLEGVEENWQEVLAVQTMIVLAGQILAGTRTGAVAVEVVGFLRKARGVCLAWTRELAGKLPDCKPLEVREFQLRVVQMAATCRMTFDVEKRYLQDVLSTGEDVAVLVECATMIHDNIPVNVSALPTGLKALLESDKRMAYAVEKHLRGLVTSSIWGIDLKPIWSAYEQGTSWVAEDGQNERWVYTYTEASEGSESQKVYYNLISGELLVEGQPLGRLPVGYTSHATYLELFGEKVLNVFPSSIPGMIFQTKHPIYGHRVAFALYQSELMIRAECVKSGFMHQLIPRSKLLGDFPTNIIHSYVFWLRLPSASGISASGIFAHPDYINGRIDLRNIDTPWTPNDTQYISHSYNPSKTQLNFGPQNQLLDVRSATTTMITNALAPLESAEFINVSFRNYTVNVHLPRLKLDFRSNRKNKLQCQQFQPMVIDDNQHIGTLIGLENLLVVRQGPIRSIIVPHGNVLFERRDSHTKVRIDTTGKSRVKYHIYTVNTVLGTLVGNGSLTSQLYKIYLHAVTSHCLPDPLTRRTGTEEALSGLRAAATRSFQAVETDGVDAELFSLIAALTPVRVYYPVHLKRVKEVSAYAGLLNIFEDVKGSIVWRTAGDEDLAKKAAMRNAFFRTEQFGGSMVDKSEDRIYEGRDMVDGSYDEARVSYVASLVERGQGEMNVHPRLLGMLERLEGEIRGLLPMEGVSKLQLGYDHKWLDPNLAEVWVELFDALRGGIMETELYGWMFLFSTLAYPGKIDFRLIETLLAFGTEGAFRELKPPNYPSYKLQDGYEPDIEILCNTIKACAIDFGVSEESELDGWALETELQTHERRFEIFTKNKDIQETAMACELLLNWPCTELKIDEDDYPLYKVSEVLLSVKPWFESWNRNSEFRDHIAEVQRVLDNINTNQRPVFQFYHFDPCEYSRSLLRNTIRFADLLTRPHPTLPARPRLLAVSPIAQESSAHLEPKDDSLGTLLRDFREQSPNKFQDIYTKQLEKSIVAFQGQIILSDTIKVIGLVDELKSLQIEYENYMWAVFRAIEVRLAPLLLKGSFMAFKAGLWPRVSPMLLLQQLATNGAVRLSLGWKKVLVTYGVAITMLQRLQRLIRLAPRLDHDNELTSDFRKEFENTGHQEWDPFEHPDWLLIEIENNFLIRPVQADIASSMITPKENLNSIMQLCMGEGKTSVIVPIVAASLADGMKLVRVVVLKPLSGQMFQTLVQKLGGLVNRRIFFMPFSRGIAMGKREIEVVKQLYEDCMQSGGILLVQPEHILSFKLLGLEWLYNSKNKRKDKSDTVGSNEKSDPEVAQLLLDTQAWLEARSRDILDESDEILNVRHELIYTIGNPAPIQNHPDRWVIIQEIFDLIQAHFKTLEVSVEDFEVETHKQARFGSIRILNTAAGKKLLCEIAEKIIKDQLLTISFRHFDPDNRELANRFIIDTDMTEQEAIPLLKYFGENDIGILYLLRGLIAHNILLFSLKEKRWKVDYGLDLKRSLLAVPYRAKDSPSGKAEFSHPDVAITLTCLSYYYGGLNEPQLETCFRNLYKSDNPALEYECWIKDIILPESYLKRLSGINLEDKKQWKEVIYPTFNYNKAVIDSYLSGVVFPKEAKEFPHKLSTSGWDVGGSKVHPTTGFSGTNDNRYLLPLSMKQLDRTEQLNTNARVLNYLLQKENSYLCTAGPNNKRTSVEELLEILTKRGGRQFHVLLDVGAQVLELRNHEVAKRWLELVAESSAKAAVYFNDNDELTVLTRDGNTEPLMVSTFAESLGSCLVYLDEAHTRGTDLKLPIKSNAAVTLGPNLTKDRLVQACMRMRKLGNGHSVMFCGPPEIDRIISGFARADGRETINVRDVLFWCMEETCKNALKLLPIWAKQGINYQKHLKAWKDIGEGKGFPKGLLEKESKTLKQHYGFQRSKDETIDSYRNLRVKGGGLDKILSTCEYFGVDSLRGARMLEEQERELAHEAECERENQRPSRVDPAKPHVSPTVKQFIATGTLQRTYHQQSTNIIPAFNVLRRTSVNEHRLQAVFSQRLLATLDFCEVFEGGGLTDDFLRPVNWIVSSTMDRNILVIMSSFEVNKLLPEIRESSHVVLHMYSPQVIRSTPSYEALDFCPVPCLPHLWQPNTPLIDQLNIFAGQLYFQDYKAYERVCGFLGLYLDENSSKRVIIHSDGFVDKPDRQGLGMKYESPFVKSPVSFLKGLIGFRRKGQSYITTHMGHVLHGRLLTEADFEVQRLEEVFSQLSVDE